MLVEGGEKGGRDKALIAVCSAVNRKTSFVCLSVFSVIMIWIGVSELSPTHRSIYV